MAGKSVGETIEVPDQFSGATNYEIVSLDSALHALAGIAQRVIGDTVSGSGSIISVSIPIAPDGLPDLSRILALLKAKNERAKTAFAVYGDGPIPIGSIAKVLGAPVAVVTADWPSTAPPLYVFSGAREEEERAQRRLMDRNGSLVVDLSAINELVASNAEESLQTFEKVLISSSAVSTLTSLIEKANDPRETGHLQEVDGRVSMVEYTPEFRAARLDYLRRVQTSIDRHCTVVPAWGAEEIPHELAKISEFLDRESFDALLLCLEHDGLLLTLDGRLREAAAALAGIAGVWPQIFCANAVTEGLCDLNAYHHLVFSSLAKHRTHVGVNALDILWLIGQKDDLKARGLNDLLQYFGDTRVDLLSALNVALGGIKAVVFNGGTLAAMADLLGALARPVLLTLRCQC